MNGEHPSPSPKEREIFLGALDQPTPKDREKYLTDACGEDHALRTSVLALLENYRDDDFLEMIASAARPSGLLAEKIGDTIGTYTLLDQIGEGGCGVVYRAEQKMTIHRQVALKIIKLGMDTRDVIARFEAERQVLAMMDHSNIAKVFDAGATKTGRPYFVMELVCGKKITDYCNDQKLTLTQRLDLFVKVCHAVQHAHQKGIIHRDLKPSNILVVEQDGTAMPKVIDFGIAKATTGQQLTDKTIYTAREQFVGTPAYMSPEQAGHGEVDARSDIYSLGVLLYELLVGQPPFQATLPNDEIFRAIREKEPLCPSLRFAEFREGERVHIADLHGTAPAKLFQSLRGDLDCIVMKCLEKGPVGRYQTADGLAAEVQHYLKGEPVTVRPKSWPLRFQKLVQMRRLQFGAVVIVLLILCLFGFWKLNSTPATLTTLASFDGTNGKKPVARLLQTADGKFYGTTFYGGPYGSGVIFRMSASGSMTTLFTCGRYGGLKLDGDNTYGTHFGGGPVQGNDGNFYFTTVNDGPGGCGDVLQMTPSGSVTTIASFKGINGQFGGCGLVKGNDGNLYGTTQYGGTGYNDSWASGNGTIFVVTPAGHLTVLHNFSGADGAGSCVGLTLGREGNLYGVRSHGGPGYNGNNTSGDGTVFRITPSGSFTLLYSFTGGGDGATPSRPLVLGADGNFYGTTQEGGATWKGTVFKMTPDGKLTTLHSFSGLGDGAHPDSEVLQASDGNLYGTTVNGGTSGKGTIFRLDPSGNLTTIYSFTGGSDGANPHCGPIQGSDGQLYGTTSEGGTMGMGTVYKFNLEAPGK